MKVHLSVLSKTQGESETDALRAAIALAPGSPRVITVVVPAKRNVNTQLAYVLSEALADKLLKGHRVKIADDAIALLESNQTLATTPERQVVVAIRGWSDLIPKIRKVNSVDHLFVVAPNEDEAEKWRNEFDVIEHNNAFNSDAGKAGAG